jgi:hypothetical protein
MRFCVLCFLSSPEHSVFAAVVMPPSPRTHELTPCLPAVSALKATVDALVKQLSTLSTGQCAHCACMLNAVRLGFVASRSALVRTNLSRLEQAPRLPPPLPRALRPLPRRLRTMTLTSLAMTRRSTRRLRRSRPPASPRCVMSQLTILTFVPLVHLPRGHA